MRNFRKLKTLSDWSNLDEPVDLGYHDHDVPENQMVLRMLVRPKYQSRFMIPKELEWLEDQIRFLAIEDWHRTGIKNSWCYVTVRSGVAEDTADTWHFDGASLRVELIPERNYVWVDSYPFEYKMGGITYPDAFDPLKHSMFTFAEDALKNEPIHTAKEKHWYLLSPFVFHRRTPQSNGKHRTFIRVSFIDIEVRDVLATQNPKMPTEAFDRNPISSFRDRLTDFNPKGT